jgi:hypothetical protein
VTRRCLGIRLFLDTFTCSYVYSHLPRVGTLLIPRAPRRKAPTPSPLPLTHIVEQADLQLPQATLPVPTSSIARTLLTLQMDFLFDIVDGVWRTAPTRPPPRHLIVGTSISREARGHPPLRVRPLTPRPDSPEQEHVEEELAGDPISLDENLVRAGSRSIHEEAPLVQGIKTDGVSALQEDSGPLSPQVWSCFCAFCRIVLTDRITLGRCHNSVGSGPTRST